MKDFQCWIGVYVERKVVTNHLKHYTMRLRDRYAEDFECKYAGKIHSKVLFDELCPKAQN